MAQSGGWPSQGWNTLSASALEPLVGVLGHSRHSYSLEQLPQKQSHQNTRDKPHTARILSVVSVVPGTRPFDEIMGYGRC